MNQPPLRLELHYYDEVHSSLSPEPKLSENPTSFGTGVWSSVFENHEDPLKFMLRMKIRLPHPSSDVIPIRGEFGIIGIFSVEESVPMEQRALLVKNTGGAMLYSAAREFILLVTYRTSPFPPFYLPTLSGKDLADAPDIEAIQKPGVAARKSSRSRKSREVKNERA